MPDTFIGTIIGITEPGLPSFRECPAVNSKTMILRSDITTLGSFLYTRLILTAVTEFEFIGIGSGS